MRALPGLDAPQIERLLPRDPEAPRDRVAMEPVRRSAVERLAADRAKYVQGRPGVGRGPASEGSSPVASEGPAGDPRPPARVPGAVARRAVARKPLRPDSLVIYRQKCEFVRGPGADHFSGGLVKKLFQGPGKDKTPAPPETSAVGEEGRARAEEAASTGPGPVVTPAPPAPSAPTRVPAAPTRVSAAPTRVPAAPTRVSAAPTRVSAAPTGVSAAPTGVSAAPTTVSAAPTRVSAAPTRVSAAPTRVSAAPTRVSAAPTTVSAAPTRVSAAPTRVPAAPTTVSAAPTRVSAAPTRVSAAPTTVSAAPTRVSAAPTRVSAAPTTVSAAPTRVSAAPTRVPAAPTTVSAAPTRVSAAPTRVSAAPTRVPAAPTTVSAAPTRVSAAPTTVSAAPTTVSAAPTRVPAAPTTVSAAPATVSAASRSPKLRGARRRGLHRSQSDLSSRYSMSLAELDTFFQYCGLEPEVVEALGRENFSAGSDRLALKVHSVSVAASDSGFSRHSRDDEGLQEGELTEQVPSTTSVIERNARIIRWLYTCKKAKEAPSQGPRVPA